MLVFNGKTGFRYLNDSNFYALTESVAYVRSFTGVNSTAAESDVVSDLNSTFLPLLAYQNTPNAWTGSFYGASETLNALSGILLMFLTSAGILVGAFLVKQSDYKTDAFDTRGI